MVPTPTTQAKTKVNTTGNPIANPPHANVRRPDPHGDYYQLYDPNNRTKSTGGSNGNRGTVTGTGTGSGNAVVRTSDENGSMVMIHVYYDDVTMVSEQDHPEYYMSRESLENLRTDALLSDYDKMIIQRLACRKFHIPGNTFWQDYTYWFCNNHPFFCFCYADKRHPFGYTERIINLVSSLAFGLCATCCVVLWFYYQRDNRNFNKVLFSINQYVNVTTGMITLFAFSGPIHVLFDLGIFFLQACPPCRMGGLCEVTLGLPSWHQQIWIWLGTNLAFVITIVSCILAIKVMLMRASINESGTDTEIANNIENYSFLLLYLAEITIANFVAFPICTFIVFSGVLGCCGRIPGIGGRPYQVRKHQKYMERKRVELQQQQRNNQQKTKLAYL